MSSERSSNFLMRWTYFQLISALLHVSKVERNSCRFFYMPKGVDHKIRPHRFGGEGVLIGGQQQH